MNKDRKTISLKKSKVLDIIAGADQDFILVKNAEFHTFSEGEIYYIIQMVGQEVFYQGQDRE